MAKEKMLTRTFFIAFLLGEMLTILSKSVAPFSRSSFAVSVLSLLTAIVSAVSPLLSLASMFAPFVQQQLHDLGLAP